MEHEYKFEIRWKNFRALNDTGWLEIRPLTILIGPNNSGKSSVVAPLLMMSQTMASRDADTSLVTRGPIIDAGSYNDLIHKRDSSRNLFLGFRFHTHDPAKIKKIDEVGAYPPGAIEVELTYDEETNKPQVTRYSVYDIFKRRLLTQSRTRSGKYSIGPMKIREMGKSEGKAIRETTPVNFLFSPSEAIYSAQTTERPDRTPDSGSFSTAFSFYLQAVGYAFSAVRAELEDISYVGPLRERNRRYYDLSGEIAASVGARGQNTANVLQTNWQTLRRDVNRWIQAFELGDELRIDKLSRDLFSLNLWDSQTKMQTNIADAGFGASQVLPLIVQAVSSEAGCLTIAEQPEIHLNPRLQCVLADLFVEMAAKNRRVIVETHSEHLLLRLRRLVASGEISSDDVALYFVEKRDGISRLRRIPINRNGHIDVDRWPIGFFGDSLREALALASEQSQLQLSLKGKDDA